MVLPEEHVQLRMERMAKKQLHHDFLCLYLRSQATQTLLVLVRRDTDCQLIAEFASQLLFQPNGGLIVYCVVGKDGDRGGPAQRRKSSRKEKAKPHLTLTGLLMEGLRRPLSPKMSPTALDLL